MRAVVRHQDAPPGAGAGPVHAPHDDPGAGAGAVHAPHDDPGSGPTAEDTGVTRILRSSEAAQAGSSGSGATVVARLDAMRRDEIGRINVYARLMFFLGLFGVPVIPLLRGDPTTERLLMIAVATVMLSFGWLWWKTRSPAGYDDFHVALASQIQCLAAHCATYFFGVFSPFPAIVAVGIYVYSLGSTFRYAFWSYLNLAIGYAVLGGAVVFGGLEDRGLVHAEYLAPREQLVVLGCVHVVYAVAFMIGRLSRQRTVQSMTELERAIRSVAQREALLSEARQELDRSAWVGGPGRFSDQVLGSFRLGEVIGRGAMGEIYAASRVSDEAPAAVKVLNRSTLDASRNHLARFVREAQVAATIAHPNVVRFLEVGDANQPVPYLAMERLEGYDLAHALRERRRLRLPEVVDLVEQIARGLEAARKAGIVHRDLKPHNLFRQAGATWKILDFGVSKLVDDTETLTRGMVIGTPAYMAPEQASGHEVDHRADVYSLAVIAYRALTGQPAFSGTQVPQVLYDVVHRMPLRPSSLADLPEEIDQVMAVALAKRPNDRFQRAGDFARHFAEAAAGRLHPNVRRQAERLLERAPWDSTGA